MNKDPLTGEVSFSSLERKAAPILPPSINGGDALEAYEAVNTAILYLTQSAREARDSPLAIDKCQSIALTKKAQLLGNTAAQLFDEALVSWPISDPASQ